MHINDLLKWFEIQEVLEAAQTEEYQLVLTVEQFEDLFPQKDLALGFIIKFNRLPYRLTAISGNRCEFNVIL